MAFKKIKGLVSSAKGDLNALKSKFGIGRSLSNKFDQRISDGLDDLLGNLLGVRTSNIPEIDGKVAAAKQDRRAKRIEAIEGYDKRTARQTPPGSQILTFPKSYFNEKGTAKDKFPNSIHFRSLPRKKFDASEGGLGKGREEGGDAWDAWGDRGAWGSVDPRAEPIYDIFLYLPHQLGDAVKLTYESSEAGMMDTFFASLFSFGDTDDAVNESVGGSGGGDAMEFLQVIKDALPGGKIVQQATGALVNPMKFQSFTGVDFRDYSYKFDLKPSTPQEAFEIKKIIAAFKLSSLPGTAGENGRIWTQPNEWAIKFRGPVQNWVDFPMTVVCSGVEVDYSGGGAYTLLEDGSPSHYSLTLSFQETTQLSRQRYMDHVSALTGDARDFTKAERGTQIMDQLHRDEGITVNMTDEELQARQKPEGP